MCDMRSKLPHSKEGSEKRSRGEVRGPKKNQRTPNIAIRGSSSSYIALGLIIGVSKSRF